MLCTKPEVDRHVAKALAKLRSDREKCLRGYSISRLYFDIGDFDTCVRYLTQYLTVKDNNAVAHNLLGQAYRKLGRKEEALAEFKTSLELDSSQNSLILKVCELLSEETMNADPGCMRYWVDRAGVAFPRHPTVFRLNQRLLQAEDADSSTIATLLKEQISARPSHPPSHARFLQHLLQFKQVREAFDYAYETHTSNRGPFSDSHLWLDAIVQVVEAYKTDVASSTDATVWNYWLLCLTVLERKTYLQLQKSTPTDVMSALKTFDKALYDVSVCQKLKLKDHLLKHFGGQFCLYGGSAILMKAVHSQMNWRDAVRFATPLFLLAFQIESPDTQQKDLSSRWSSVASYRISQAGHMISVCFKEKKRLFLDNISQYFSDKSWRNKLYKDLFGNGDISKMSSYIVNPKSFLEPALKFPNFGIELQQSDLTSRLFSTGSLHLQTWIGLNVEKLSKISSIETDELPLDIDNLSYCGPESLCKYDIDAFLYCTILIAQKNIEISRKLNSGKSGYQDRPNMLPEVLMEPLCSAEQAKWWEYVEFSVRRDTGCQSSDIRSHLIRGIEAVRCLANHGIDPYILQAVAKIFSQRADIDTNNRVSLLKRAKVYYENALLSLEKLHDRISYNVSKNQIFNFTTQDTTKERTNYLIEEAKLFLGNYYMENNDNDKAIEILTSVKSPYASFNLFKIHMKLADDQKECTTMEMKSKRFSLLSKARKYVYITLDKVRDHSGESHPLSEIIDECIANVEKQFLSMNMDSSACKLSENEYSSDQQSSVDENNQSESTPVKFREPARVLSSSSSMKAQLYESKRKESVSESVLQQISALLESNKMLTEQVSEIKSSLKDFKSHQMDSVDKRKFLNSVDDIRSKVDELREENCNNTMDLKREINNLRKELEKLKISPPSAAQRQDDNELLLLDETYKNHSAALSYLSRVNNGNPPMPPANPYSLFPPNLYPLYAGQFPAVPHVFPPPTLFPPDQTLYSELLVPPQVPPPQPAQSAIHDYHIPLPAQSQPVAPSILSTQSTSTPNKPPVLDTAHINPVLPQNFSIFDAAKSNSLFDTSKNNSTLDISKPTLNLSLPFNFSKDKPEVSAVNKSRTLSEKSNDSYDPLPDYQPMVPLPDEIVPTTGEEDEDVIFDSRAKLFRFISGEWKERGLGQLKLLKNQNTGKIRLLMRRDIVHTVCANHIISPEIELSPMKGSDKAYFWVANDFADETVKLEKFSVRFKTVEIGKKFFETFNNSKNQAITVSNENKTEKTSQDLPISKENPKPAVANSIGGFTFTTAPTLKVVEKETAPAANTTTTDTKPNPFASFTFKKAPTFNTTSSAVSTTNTFQTSTISQIDNKATQEESVTTTTLSGWGDKFKPKAGSWSCSACYITNDATVLYCVACDNPKEPGMPKKPEPKPTVDVSKFTFGFPPAVSAPAGPIATSAPIASVTSAPNIGLTNTFKFGFDIPTTTTTTTTSFSFGQAKSPAKTDNQPFILGAMENTKYEFAFTPKPTVPKSPNKSLNESANDDNDVSQEDEGHHIFFEPVIPMPEKVDVKTGEEDEDSLYVHRAKLFRFCESEWKECGVGDVKILQHKTNKKIRVLMRREPVMKICLNHYLTEDTEYLTKDEKSWMFSACDFSTGEICPQQFCIRFVNKSVAEEFKTAAENAKKLLPGTMIVSKDVEFVNESEVTESELKEARKLMLPDKFHSYKNLPPCAGCRGCETEDGENAKVNDPKQSENKQTTFAFKIDAQKTSESVIVNKPIFGNTSAPSQGPVSQISFGTTPTFNTTSMFNTTTPSIFNPKSIFFNSTNNSSKVEEALPKNDSNIFKSTNNAPALEALLKSNQGKPVTFKVGNDTNVPNNPITTPTVGFGSLGQMSGNIFGNFTTSEALKTGQAADKTKTNQKTPLILDNPVINFSKNKVGNEMTVSDNDVIFISESQVTEKEIAIARDLMLPDKFYSYKDLPPCPGCRGCENESESIENVSSKIPTSVSSFENKPISGVFNFENFTMPTAPTEYLFGGNVKIPTTASVTAQNIFGNAAATMFGSEMIFGSKSQTLFNPANTVTAPSFTDNTQNEKSFQTINKPFTKGSVFGANLHIGANNQAVTTSPSSGLLEKLLASSETTDIRTDKNNGESDQNKSSFWTVKTPFSFGKIDNKITEVISTDKTYENVSDDDNPPDDDGQHIFFKPQIPLPDEVEVKTGEEQEEVLYSHRSKLYRFADSEWKECGVGDIKILHNAETNKLRVLMRREPILKVCLNHWLTSDINYLVKDEKSWLFSVCDFSTGEITPQQFCIRFGNKNFAQEFKNAIDDARNKYINSDAVPEASENKETVEIAEVQTPKNDSDKVTPSTEKPVNNKPLVKASEFTPPASITSPVVVEKPLINNPVSSAAPIFGSQAMPTFNSIIPNNTIFGSGEYLSFEHIANKDANKNPNESENLFAAAAKQNEVENKSIFTTTNKTFTWEGAGTPLFSSGVNKTPANKDDSQEKVEETETDPHFEPIIPLPDKIEVITGEEDEVVSFNERCKLFRFTNGEWRERGIGEIKILHHPVRGTYRMLLRQDQVFKVVLNQLITRDLNMLPMPNSPKALMWAGMNYTDDEKGVVEKLAVRFRNEQLMQKFDDKVKNIIEILHNTSNDEILVTDVPEEFIKQYQDHEDNDGSDQCDESYNEDYYHNYDDNS